VRNNLFSLPSFGIELLPFGQDVCSYSISLVFLDLAFWTGLDGG